MRQVRVVNMIPRSMSGETNQDSEPQLTVDPDNPRTIVGTTFTPDPGGGPQGPVFASFDGGRIWTLDLVILGGSLTINPCGLAVAQHSTLESCVVTYSSVLTSFAAPRTQRPRSCRPWSSGTRWTSRTLPQSRQAARTEYSSATTTPKAGRSTIQRMPARARRPPASARPRRPPAHYSGLPFNPGRPPPRRDRIRGLFQLAQYQPGAG